jgi:hypothetical protein
MAEVESGEDLTLSNFANGLFSWRCAEIRAVSITTRIPSSLKPDKSFPNGCHQGPRSRCMLALLGLD